MLCKILREEAADPFLPFVKLPPILLESLTKNRYAKYIPSTYNHFRMNVFLWLRTASILFLIIIRLLQRYKWIQWNYDKCPGVRRTETGLLWLESPEKHIQNRMSEASTLSQIWEQRVSFFLQLMMHLQFASFPLPPDNEQSVFTSLILSFWNTLPISLKGKWLVNIKGWQSINKATKTHRH